MTGWTNPATRVLWFGQFTNSGSLVASLDLRLPAKAESTLRLSIDGEARTAIVRGDGTNIVAASFGTYQVNGPGYRKFVLESLTPAGQAWGDIDALNLGGAAAATAHFNLKPRRNAASVHLNYPVPRGTNVSPPPRTGALPGPIPMPFRLVPKPTLWVTGICTDASRSGLSRSS